MKPHAFWYFVYEADGKLICQFQHKHDAQVMARGPLDRKIVRKDILGNYPDKIIEP